MTFEAPLAPPGMLAPDAVAKALGKRTQPKAKITSRKVKSWIQTAPLLPWMRDFVIWLCEQDYKPKISAQTAMASKLCHRTVTTMSLRELKLRKDVRDLIERYSASQEALARAKAMRHAAKTIDARQTALEEATRLMTEADLEKNRLTALRTVSQMTEPILDRVWPKREEAAQVAPRVVINVGAGSFAAKAITRAMLPSGEVTDVEYEVLGTTEEPTAE